MPNHITNYVFVKYNEDLDWDEREERFQKLADSLKGQEITHNGETTQSEFDFNKIVPMPEELQHTTSPSRIVPDDEYEQAVAKAKEDNEKNPNFGLYLPLTQKMADEYRDKFGATNWYDWSVQNWGTKWNAYSIEVLEGGWKFDTAWSSPGSVIEALSKQHPEVVFQVAWADEGGGGGYYEYQNGEVLTESYSGSDDEITVSTQVFERLVKGW